MSYPINKIKLKNFNTAKQNGNYQVLIDNRLLNDHIVAVANNWSDKNKAILNIEELKRSCSASGSFNILICANCAASGYITSEDISLQPFSVTHADDYVRWSISAPELFVEQLNFTFDRRQYLKEMAAIKSD